MIKFEQLLGVIKYVATQMVTLARYIVMGIMTI